jgi:hypothetical protein
MAKKKQPQMSSKAEQKLKNKIIEDKTFGLKNKKKSSKVAKYVQQVQQQVNQAGNRKAMVTKYYLIKVNLKIVFQCFNKIKINV